MASKQANSWLSLVAETAGVSGATIARVEIQSFRQANAYVRAVIQIQDMWGQVIGATSWEGEAAALHSGVMIDLGCDLGTAVGTRLVGWIEERPFLTEPHYAIAPEDAAAHFFEPGRAMKLMLNSPQRSASVARHAA